MRKSKKSGGEMGSMDSLVDIVSNIVGILIILAAFMALFGLVNPANLPDSSQSAAMVKPPEKLLVPWSRPTTKNVVLFALRGNRLFHFDMRAFFRELADRPPEQRPVPLAINQPGLKIRFFPVTNQIYCLEFEPGKDAGETWLEASGSSSRWRKVRKLYRPENFYYFFWVANDSFELFRDVRSHLWEERYEVGWKPVSEDSQMEICNGFEGSAGFQPQ